MLHITVRKATDAEKILKDAEIDDYPDDVSQFDSCDGEDDFLGALFNTLKNDDYVISIKDDDELFLSPWLVGTFVVHLEGRGGCSRKLS